MKLSVSHTRRLLYFFCWVEISPSFLHPSCQRLTVCGHHRLPCSQMYYWSKSSSPACTTIPASPGLWLFRKSEGQEPAPLSESSVLKSGVLESQTRRTRGSELLATSLSTENFQTHLSFLLVFQYRSLLSLREGWDPRSSSRLPQQAALPGMDVALVSCYSVGSISRGRFSSPGPRAPAHLFFWTTEFYAKLEPSLGGHL